MDAAKKPKMGSKAQGNVARQSRTERAGILRDAGLIAAANRVEHYEIATYGSARDFAQKLGLSNAATLFQETLDEEKETDEKLTELAEQINSQGSEEGEEEDADAEAEIDAADQNRSRKKPRRVA